MNMLRDESQYDIVSISEINKFMLEFTCNEYVFILVLFPRQANLYTVVQRLTAVTAYFTSKQLLLFAFAG